MKRLVIIDGKSVFYRGYYAMPNLSRSDGTPTGGVYGFAALSLEIIKKLEPDYVCVAWDKPKTNIRKRRQIYPDYKAGRKPAPADFYTQIPLLHDLLAALNWPLYELDDYEADDIMATLARQAEGQDIETCLISSDLDMLQALAPNTHMYALKKGFSHIELYKPAYFEQKYGIKVEQFLDLKSLKGDASDNIPGVPGVGEKGAIKLLQQYKSLDGIYQNIEQIPGALGRKLADGQQSAQLSRQVASLMFDAPIELDLAAMNAHELDKAELVGKLKQLEFTSLLRGLPEYMQLSSQEKTEREALAGLKLVDWSNEFSTRSLMAEAVMVLLINDQLYISIDDEVATVEAKQIEHIIDTNKIITHDGDALCRYLLSHKISLPKTIFDTRQAGFLLNPLKKSRTLADVTGSDSDDPLVLLAHIKQVYQAQVEQLAQLPKLEKVAYEIDFPMIMLLAKIEQRGILLDKAQLDDMNRQLTTQIDELNTDMHQMVGRDFNIASPAQLSEVLFGDLSLPTTGIKKGKTGFSTGQKELDKLRGLHPIIEKIETFRELTKLQNTYVMALPKLTDANSRLHTTFNQDVAATGRLSSTDPNLQNIPIRSQLGRKIRQAFIPSPGNVFVSADYSQFELRLVAILAGDEKMINDFNAGTDIHAKTAADMHQIPLDDVTKAQRRAAKVINFGVLYGMGPHALAGNTGMSFAQAKQYIDSYFQVRSKVRDYIDNTVKVARRQGFVETFYGRRRPTPDLSSSNFIVRSSAERAAANMPIQGTEADLMKKSMLAVEDKLPDSAQQVLQIHDSILVECPTSEADKVAQIMKNTMEQIAPELEINLQVDVSIGQHWGEV